MFTTNTEKQVVDWILYYKEKRGASDVHLFTAAGISRPAWKDRISGKYSFHLDQLISVANALGVSLEDITSEEMPPVLAKDAA